MTGIASERLRQKHVTVVCAIDFHLGINEYQVCSLWLGHAHMVISDNRNRHSLNIHVSQGIA